MVGTLGGLIVGVVAWLVMAANKKGGLQSFLTSTGDPEVMLVGNACALGVGGLLCMVVSLSCGKLQII